MSTSSRARVFEPLRYPAFRRAWLAAILDGFGSGIERLAVAWFVLDATGSVFLAALSFAARAAPNMFFGPVGGAIADRFERPRVLRTTVAARALLILAVGSIVLAGVHSAWPLLALIALTGVARASETPATQALIRDIVGGTATASAVSLHSFGIRTIAMIGALAGGFLIRSVGPGQVFLIAGCASIAASFTYSTVRVVRTTPLNAPTTSVWTDAAEGLGVVLRLPVILLLLLLALGIEVFAFSYQSLMPGLADRVLHVDAAGLGMLTSAAGLGGVLGLAALSLFVDVVRRGPLLVVVTTVFAAGLLALSASEHFTLSLVLVAVVGAMAGMFDALQWVLLQASVPNAVRGRVIGTWMAAIGFGWLGPLILGGTAEAVGVQWAIASGGLVAAVLAGIALSSTRLRRL